MASACRYKSTFVPLWPQRQRRFDDEEEEEGCLLKPILGEPHEGVNAAVVSSLPPHLHPSPCMSSPALFPSTIGPSPLCLPMWRWKSQSVLMYSGLAFSFLQKPAQAELPPQFSLAVFCLSNQSW